MKSSLLRALIAMALVLGAAAQSGNHHFPTPPEPLDGKPQKEAAPTLTRHVDYAGIQKEADELSRTAQTIPSDIESIRKGMLPKDAIEKLKHIEKLSKRLRSELNP